MGGATIIFSLMIVALLFIRDSVTVIATGYSMNQSIHFSVREELSGAAQLGIGRAMGGQSGIIEGSKFSFVDSVIFDQMPWGVYQVCESKAYWSDESTGLFAFTGIIPSMNTSFYVIDNKEPIYLSGNARLQGTIKSSASGFRRKRIDNRNYNGSELFYGEHLNSEKTLPQIRQELLEKFTPEKAQQKGIVPDSLEVPFSAGEVGVYHTTGLGLNGKKFKGQIIINSEKPVFLDKSTELEDVIIIAPSLVVDNGFSGSFQALCCDSIVVKENVILEYPSALCILDNGSNNPSQISIGKNSRVHGCIILKQENHRVHEQPSVCLNSGSQVWGLVWVEARLDNRGNVIGSAFVEFVFVDTKEGVYSNCILDGQFEEAPNNLTAWPDIFSGEKKCVVTRWI